jgi:hypothetical protein
MSEWTMDFPATYVDPCTDCAYMSPVVAFGSSSSRVFRGADYAASAPQLVPTYRSHFAVQNGGVDDNQRGGRTGFRCARTPVTTSGCAAP